MKMIRMDEVQVRDVVGYFVDRPITVNRVSRVKRHDRDIHNRIPGGVALNYGNTDGVCIVDAPDKLIALFHRPYAEGVTRGALKKNILLFMRIMASVAEMGDDAFENHLRRTRAIMDEHDLGKPLE